MYVIGIGDSTFIIGFKLYTQVVIVRVKVNRYWSVFFSLLVVLLLLLSCILFLDFIITSCSLGFSYVVLVVDKALFFLQNGLFATI